MEKRSNKTVFCLTKGFTLIELLVVVLIIGILAAVALPQYNKAVRKSQGSEALEAIHTLQRGLAALALETGKNAFDTTVNELPIVPPALKHFKYSVGPVGNSATEFKVWPTDDNTNIQIGSHLSLVSPEGVEVRIMGETTSSLSSMTAYCNDNFATGGVKCKDYFNGHYIQVGTKYYFYF